MCTRFETSHMMLLQSSLEIHVVDIPLRFSLKYDVIVVPKIHLYVYKMYVTLVSVASVWQVCVVTVLCNT